MTDLRIGDQLIRFDREATVTAYSRVPRGDADRCPCLGCRNFARQRDKAYPDEFRAFLTTLGIDANKEGEAFSYGPKGKGHYYGGWFYFVGELVETGERLVNSGGEFQYFVGTSFPRPPEVFGKTVASVEFTTLIPWVLKEPWDPVADAQIMKTEEIMDRYSNALRALANRRQ